MKKRILVLSFLSAVVFLPPVVSAKDREGLKPTFRAEKKELRTELKEKMQGLRDSFKEKVDNLRSQMVKITGAEITSISGTTLTVSKEGKTYTVNTDSNTHFQRHFWGGSTLAEFSVGNKVNIHGKFTDDSKTAILARMIRNLSIMKRHGVFIGEVAVKNSDHFILSSKNRGEQKVFFNTSTKFVKRDETAMIYADLQVGHRVRVKGLWDKSSNEVTETVQVKDYNLPPKPTKVGGPTNTITPTSGPTLTPTNTPTLTLTPTP